MSKAGYGPVGAILEERADVVVLMIEYEIYCKKIEEEELKKMRDDR